MTSAETTLSLLFDKACRWRKHGKTRTNNLLGPSSFQTNLSSSNGDDDKQIGADQQRLANLQRLQTTAPSNIASSLTNLLNRRTSDKHCQCKMPSKSTPKNRTKQTGTKEHLFLFSLSLFLSLHSI